MANFFKRLFGNDEPAKKESVKEEGRYYFYNDRCSFKLDSEIIKSEEENGKKFILKTEKLEAVIWIIPEMPIHSRYPWIVGTEEKEVAGYHCEVAYTKTPSGIYPSYFIDCGEFVIQVNLPNQNTKEETEFINSFKLEGCFAQNNHDYIDLGLPSGTLWATCNVGATTPESDGDYFAWGETRPKTTYSWNTYRYGDSNQLTKYCNESNHGCNGFTDKLTALQSGDDAATANWGSDWCMPTKEQWKELLENTTNKWTTQNGVQGMLFIRNGNSLFLPAAGARWDDELHDVGSSGVYWSSSLNTGYSVSAWGFFGFNSGYYDMNGYSGRYYGQSVRPVRSARQN